jgi:predicted HicB family RNase H-like nuclease
MNTLEFRGYEGSIEPDSERGVYRGRLLFIDDLVTYEAATTADLRKEFEAAVQDYIETCRALGRDPQVPSRQQCDNLDRTTT